MTKKTIIQLFFVLVLLWQLLFPADASAEETDIMDRYNNILKLIGKKEYDQAITRLKEMIKSHPEFHRAYKKLVEVYHMKKDIKHAVLFFDNLIQKDRGNAYAHYALGQALIIKKQYKEAIQRFKKAIELDPGFPESFKLLVDACLNIKKDSEKRSEELENYFNELLKKNPKNACAYYGLGLLYQKKYKWENGLLMLNKAIKHNTELREAYYSKGVIYYRTNKFKEAIEAFESILELARKERDIETEGIILGNLGIFYNELGDNNRSLTYYDQALMIAEETGYKRIKGILLGNIGVIYFNSGEYEKALHFYKKALKIHKESGNKRSEGTVIGNIGIIYRTFGDYEKAMDYYKKALEIHREMRDKSAEGRVLGNIGLVYWNLQDYKKALDFFENTLTIYRELGEKSSIGRVLRHIGLVFWSGGDYEKAREYYEKALKIQREVKRKKSLGYVLNSLGNINLALKRYSRSEEYFREGLKIGKEIKAPEIIWNTLAGLGFLSQAEGKYQEALSYYEQYIQTVESVRGKLKVEDQKAGFLGGQINTYEEIVNLLFKMHQKDPTKGCIQLAFNYAERAKSRAFLDMLAESQANIKEGVDPELLIQEEKLEMEFSRTQSALQKELSKNKENIHQTRVKEMEDKINRLEIEFEHLKFEMSRKNPKYAALKYRRPVTLEELQKKILDRDTVFLEYMVTGQSTLLWKISDVNFEAFQFDIGREEIERRVKLLRHLSETSANSSAFAAQAYILYQKLVQPAMARIPKGKKLLIVPDGILNYLPFEILCTKQIENNDKLRFKALPYLIKKYPVHYVQSASVWASLQQEAAPLNPNTRKGPRKLLAFGDPVFRGETELSGNVLIRSAFRGSDPVIFKRLLYSGKEVETIGKLLKPSHIYLRQQAKEEKIKQLQDLNQYRYIHFATHGILNENKPQFSGLVLTQDDDPTEDGFLQMREILNLKINADLVVLSACRTGLGKMVRGEGIIGLSRAWMYAGTPSVMVSLWSVNDASTAQLMEQFYKNLKRGMSKTIALQKAKLRMLKKTGAVRGWAGFVLIGK